jgi:hypothetical protein
VIRDKLKAALESERNDRLVQQQISAEKQEVQARCDKLEAALESEQKDRLVQQQISKLKWEARAGQATWAAGQGTARPCHETSTRNAQKRRANDHGLACQAHIEGRGGAWRCVSRAFCAPRSRPTEQQQTARAGGAQEKEPRPIIAWPIV